MGEEVAKGVSKEKVVPEYTLLAFGDGCHSNGGGRVG